MQCCLWFRLVILSLVGWEGGSHAALFMVPFGYPKLGGLGGGKSCSAVYGSVWLS